jgi:signal transduction histidine kinase
MPKYYALHEYYPLIPILLRSFNVIVFTLLSFLSFREYRERRIRWGGNAYRAFVVTYAVLYLDLLANEWARLNRGHAVPLLNAIDAITTMLIPPLLFHIFYKNERSHLSAPRVWLICLSVTYALALMGAVGGAASCMGAFRSPLSPNAAFLPVVILSIVGGIGTLCASHRPIKDPLKCNQRRWMLLFVCVWGCVVVFWRGWNGPWLNLVKDVCPIGFVFLVTYYVERYTFFDVLIKKAAFIFSSLLLLTMYMVFVTPWMWSLPLRGWIGSLIWGFSVWPIVLLAPWVQRKLSNWLDRLWLGRRFSAAEAGQYLLSGLRSVNSESELIQGTKQLLHDVFQSEAELLLDLIISTTSEGENGSMQAPILLQGEQAGLIRIQPRPHNPRFLSEDIALLSSFAETFSFSLENLRLREQRALQEKREQSLLLATNRSELRALRAQINPHFIFNALNTIAGLIPQQPDRAEQTIEQLAEMFRYTLRRSKHEWVRLNEELEAVRTYLAIERTRFSDRLEFSILVDGKAGDVRIPAMIVQTLVENAVKHGISAIRTPGKIEVDARVSGALLGIEVRDNGPGFDESGMHAFQRQADGYGLCNVRERLQGYFGDAASLSIKRDASLEMTVVGVEMPRMFQSIEEVP